MRDIRYIFFIILFFVYSCESETPLNHEEIDANRSGIRMEMDENILLTISVDKLPESFNFLSFRLNYIKNNLTVTDVINGDFTLDFSTIDYNEISTEDLSFQFSNISGSGNLLKIQFSGTSYNETKISISDILLINSQNELWNPDPESFTIEKICYIDEGWLISAELNLPGPLSESWEPTNNYVWSNSFCY